ncbi:hypothetical protein GGQ68_004929 [Sagittula marina]|uniref:Uncharacterized protein n=1 Tax=Sagittula marina TaxID=943940 RepID=A0A7W6DVJ0_9RHOB|nr:hypothetical protein [Sagittula marina]
MGVRPPWRASLFQQQSHRPEPRFAIKEFAKSRRWRGARPRFARTLFANFASYGHHRQVACATTATTRSGGTKSNRKHRAKVAPSYIKAARACRITENSLQVIF